MPKRNAPMRLFFVFLLTFGIFFVFVVYHLHGRFDNKVFWDLYLIIQICIWFSLVYVFKKMYKNTYKDELTNLWNRRYLYSKLDREIRKVRKDKILSLAMVDIDDFKRVNDENGHLFGDEVLTKVSNILKVNVRKDDIVGRWGGEEFIIVLPNTDRLGAKAVFERIRCIIADHDFGCKITISIGFVSICEPIKIDRLIEMADYALYEAKSTKNTIVAY